MTTAFANNVQSVPNPAMMAVRIIREDGCGEIAEVKALHLQGGDLLFESNEPHEIGLRIRCTLHGTLERTAMIDDCHRWENGCYIMRARFLKSES